MFSNPESTPENAHGLSQKIQGTYFKTSALYFKIYGLYFSPFQIAEKQCLSKETKRESFYCRISTIILTYTVFCIRKIMMSDSF